MMYDDWYMHKLINERQLAESIRNSVIDPLKEYQDPNSYNYDPLRVIKERIVMEVPNFSQTV